MPVMACCVAGCTTKKSEPRADPPLTLHCIPKDEAQRKKWKLAMETNNVKTCQTNVICSKHFLESDIDRSSPFKVKLVKGAVPSIFKTPEALQSDVSKEASQEDIPLQSDTKTENSEESIDVEGDADADLGEAKPDMASSEDDPPPVPKATSAIYPVTEIGPPAPATGTDSAVVGEPIQEDQGNLATAAGNSKNVTDNVGGQAEGCTEEDASLNSVKSETVDSPAATPESPTEKLVTTFTKETMSPDMKCVVPACVNSAQDPHFSFPKDKSLCVQWLLAIPKGGWSLNEHAVVCSRHFDAAYVSGEGKDATLLPGAVPKCFLTNTETGSGSAGNSMTAESLEAAYGDGEASKEGDGLSLVPHGDGVFKIQLDQEDDDSESDLEIIEPEIETLEVSDTSEEGDITPKYLTQSVIPNVVNVQGRKGRAKIKVRRTRVSKRRIEDKERAVRPRKPVEEDEQRMASKKLLDASVRTGTPHHRRHLGRRDGQLDESSPGRPSHLEKLSSEQAPLPKNPVEKDGRGTGSKSPFEAPLRNSMSSTLGFRSKYDQLDESPAHPPPRPGAPLPDVYVQLANLERRLEAFERMLSNRSRSADVASQTDIVVETVESSVQAGPRMVDRETATESSIGVACGESPSSPGHTSVEPFDDYAERPDTSPGQPVQTSALERETTTELEIGDTCWESQPPAPDCPVESVVDYSDQPGEIPGTPFSKSALESLLLAGPSPGSSMALTKTRSAANQQSSQSVNDLHEALAKCHHATEMIRGLYENLATSLVTLMNDESRVTVPAAPQPSVSSPTPSPLVSSKVIRESPIENPPPKRQKKTAIEKTPSMRLRSKTIHKSPAETPPPKRHKCSTKKTASYPLTSSLTPKSWCCVCQQDRPLVKGWRCDACKTRRRRWRAAVEKGKLYMLPQCSQPCSVDDCMGCFRRRYEELWFKHTSLGASEWGIPLLTPRPGKVDKLPELSMSGLGEAVGGQISPIEESSVVSICAKPEGEQTSSVADEVP